MAMVGSSDERIIMTAFRLSPGVVPLNLQIQCVAREIAMRKRCFPRWVKQGRMKETDAVRELERMEAVLDTLQSLAGKQ